MDAGQTHLAGHGAELLPEVYPQTGIERPQGLVQEEDLRTRCERTGEGYALLLPSRELAGDPIRLLLQMDHMQHAPDDLLGVLLRPALDLRSEHDVVVYREMREQRIGLRQHGGVPRIG